ncbi:MAG: head GIN domain-containing protein [Phycisphaerae bacterium]
MHPIFLILSALMILTGPFGCSPTGVAGSGVERSETRRLEPFDTVQLECAGIIDIVIGRPQAMKITCDDNLLPLIETRVREGRLFIRPSRIIRDYRLTIEITAEDIKRLELHGAGVLKLTGVDNERLELALSGAAKATISGRTRRFEPTLSGIGSLRAGALTAREVDVRMSGIGSADVHALEKLDVTISGSGSVSYRGEPEISKNISGLGSLRRKE